MNVAILAKGDVWREREKFLEDWRAQKESPEARGRVEEQLVGVADRISEVLFPPEARARTLDVFRSGPEASRQLFEGGLVPSECELRWARSEEQTNAD